MKRFNNLYDAATTRAALYAAYHEACKDKKSAYACFTFEKSLSFHIEELHTRLANGTYNPKPYHQFYVYEPKRRLISAPAFRDRVVQHAVYQAIQPIFDRCFIDQSFACRPGKGTHLASDYIQYALQQAPRDSYVLQLDIHHYYASINRQILRGIIERKIKDQRMVDLIMKFAQTDEEVGTPIGNLLSQIFGLIYLNPMDHFIKRELKVKFYARYVDDFILIGITREQALDYRRRIIEFIDERLGLSLSKSSISRITKGVNFVGFRTWSSRRFVRKRALYVFRRAAKQGQVESLISCLGHAKKTSSEQHLLSYLKREHYDCYRQLPEKIRSIHHIHAVNAG